MNIEQADELWENRLSEEEFEKQSKIMTEQDKGREIALLDQMLDAWKGRIAELSKDLMDIPTNGSVN